MSSLLWLENIGSFHLVSDTTQSVDPGQAPTVEPHVYVGTKKSSLKKIVLYVQGYVAVMS